ncbi:hypothetical protein CGZ69_28100 [Streptomyces peucetius subsp. caesius ATCC 27952]|nr:hypothetical protein CGZ69_28100 [Streptomyces peucetius subsp. caesius ATCC 27952]
MGDQWRVAALPHPGFAPDEPLPATAAALAALHAQQVLELAEGAPVLLIGRSAGGWVAHAVAAALERLGAQAAGIALLDTPPSGNDPRGYALMVDGLLHREDRFITIDDHRLTAMAAYARLFREWTPEPISAPTLLVRAAAPHGPGEEPIASWRLPHETVEVPGDHFTMLEEHASTTARTVGRWARGLRGGPPSAVAQPVTSKMP